MRRKLKWSERPEWIGRCITLRDSHGRFKPGSSHPCWNGGIRHDYSSGYIYERCPGHKREDACGYVPQHVLVSEKMLGRFLKDNETVHHINSKKDDNRPENLQVMDKIEHAKLHLRIGCTNRWKRDHIDSSRLLQSLANYKNQFGKYPTQREMVKLKNIFHSTYLYYARWGSLINARKAADEFDNGR